MSSQGAVSRVRAAFARKRKIAWRELSESRARSAISRTSSVVLPEREPPTKSVCRWPARSSFNASACFDVSPRSVTDAKDASVPLSIRSDCFRRCFSFYCCRPNPGVIWAGTIKDKRHEGPRNDASRERDIYRA